MLEHSVALVVRMMAHHRAPHLGVLPGFCLGDLSPDFEGSLELEQSGFAGPPEAAKRAGGDEDNEAIEVHRRADRLCAETSRWRHRGSRCVSADGISEATFYVWKKKYANLGSTEIRELRQLREENAKLKRLVADLSLDKHILAEIVRKKSEAGA